MKYFITSAVLLLLFNTAVPSAQGAAVNQGNLARKEYHKGLSRSFGPEVPFRDYATLNHRQRQTDYSAFTITDLPEDIAIAFAESELTSSDFTVQSSYKTDLNGVTHVYLRQKVNGLEVLNGDININVDRFGNVISYGNSFAKGVINVEKVMDPTAYHDKPTTLFKKFKKGLRTIVSNPFAQVVFAPQNLFLEQQINNAQQRMENTLRYNSDEIVYNIVNQEKEVIHPTEAVLSLMAFVKDSLPDPTVLDSVMPENFVMINTLKRSHQDEDNGHPISFQYENVPFAQSPVEVRQAYIQTENGDLQLVWDLQYELHDNWYNGHVNAYDGTIVALNDWVSSASASYNVIPFGYNDPNETLQQLLKNPHDTWASPDGWHAQGLLAKGAKTFNVTIGNNAYTHTNPDGGNEWQKNYRPAGHVDEATGDVVFDYVADFEKEEPIDYEDAAVTNLFYWCNTAHDFFHRYGFDEKAGNFQQDNLGRGRTNDDGAGDAVIANAQDGSGRNNANFATPPDGKHGKMRMYIWDQTKPMRDGDFESGIVIHEYTHGVSIRLTGGPKNSNCLGWGEAGGMGEGWGDFIATVIRMRKDYTRDIDFGMGNYANGGEGIRKYKYSTSNVTNPSTYRIMDRFDYWGVHAKGEVWAEMLYEVYWNLVDRLGFTPEWFPPVPEDTYKTAMDEDDLNKVRTHITSYGNTLAVQLVIDGMKLQPCNPTFTSARDAILEAERQLTGGQYHCDIYRAFAKRGLGPGAKLERKGWIEQRVEDYSLPAICQED
ncbi:Fungalysin metallopeptidase-domain-containing protein [Mycotypha africana]|uniref:Fungalysin metallopeptidase-domain-containing protein n=1 Tax=Mycotypha africana TaxID=64632 RepID=UPI0022FFD93D|nr:Fungalysin metallopeptidase-domain-containing protein [Mycotypha africana]KAI8979534.1 Fungalysin metallopeptidase-domain-containing protein [Mycotypha africana]